MNMINYLENLIEIEYSKRNITITQFREAYGMILEMRKSEIKTLEETLKEAYKKGVEEQVDEILKDKLTIDLKDLYNKLGVDLDTKFIDLFFDECGEDCIITLGTKILFHEDDPNIRKEVMKKAKENKNIKEIKLVKRTNEDRIIYMLEQILLKLATMFPSKITNS